MPTTSRGFNVPEGTDNNDVPGDLVRLTDSIIPALTTAAIDALSWTDKPAGWLAYDTTKLRAVISTGAAMVNVIDARGGDIAGIKLTTSGPYKGMIELPASLTGMLIKSGTTIITIDKDGAASINRATVAGDTDATLVTKDYVDDSVGALGVWAAWTPTLTAATTNPTASAVAAECRYVQIGKTVTGKAQFTVTGAGSGRYRLPLPVTPRASAVAQRRIGTLQMDWPSTPVGVQHLFVEQAQSQTYCNGVLSSSSQLFFVDSAMVGPLLSSASPVTLTYDFTYEAA